MAGSQGNPRAFREAAGEVVRVLRQAGHEAYFAGGCVRDELLGLTPSDYDVATDAVPQRIASLFRSTNEVGAAFGVVLVKVRGIVVETATFRSDGSYSDKRRPDSVRFSDAREDAARRDFTINALFLDPFGQEGAERSPMGGVVIDHVRGVEDLRAGVLRAVGEPSQRLGEDHLRALRAVRLAARLGFEIEARTREAIAADASALLGVSRERVGDEVRRILAHPSRGRGVGLMEELGLARAVLGDGARSGGLIEELDAGARPMVALGAWLLERGEGIGGVGRARERLCLSNDETKELRGVLEARRDLRDVWGGWGVAGRKRLAGSAWFAGGLELVRAEDPALAGEVDREVERLSASAGGLTPEPWVTGDDLIRAGLKGGPGFKRVLDEVYDAQLEGRVGSRAEALELARRLGV